jgi:hypothetical protein
LSHYAHHEPSYYYAATRDIAAVIAAIVHDARAICFRLLFYAAAADAIIDVTIISRTYFHYHFIYDYHATSYSLYQLLLVLFIITTACQPYAAAAIIYD